jgi:hypothetical protein
MLVRYQAHRIIERQGMDAPPQFTRTLASLAPGDSGTVESFLFGSLRSLCNDLGIRQGETVRCRAGTAGVLILDTQDGHIVSVARDWARFIRLDAARAA